MYYVLNGSINEVTNHALCLNVSKNEVANHVICVKWYEPDKIKRLCYVYLRYK